jgi:O-antigen ligase
MNAARLTEFRQLAIPAAVFLLTLAAAVISEVYFIIALPFFMLLLLAGWQQISIVYLVLLVTLPWSFEYSFSRELATDIPDEFLMILVTFLFFAWYLHNPRLLSGEISRHPLLLFLFIHLLWIVLSVSFTSDYLISVKYMLAKSWYVGAFVLAPLIVFAEKKNFKAAAIVLAVSMFIVVMLILVHHSIYGFRFAEMNSAVVPFFRNHVNYGAMLVCILPVFFGMLMLNQNKRTRYYILAAMLILLVALYFSYSRGAWLALPAGLAAYWFIRKKMLVAVFIISVLMIMAGLFYIKSNDRYLQFAHDYKTTIYHKDFREHLLATYKLKDVSTAERFYRWIAGVRMIKDNGLTGYGPGTFYYHYKPYAVPAFKTWVSDNRERSTVHNYFLLIAIEQGIPGLIIFLLLLGAMLYYSQYLYHRVQDAFYKTVAATAGAITIMIFVVNFLSDLIETDKIGSIFFLCLSALIVTDIKTRKPSEPSSDIQGIS